MRSRVNVCGNVCVDMANAISIASVGYPCTCSCPWWRWSSSKAFRKHWSKQLGILPTCITTTFGRSGSRRSRRQNLNWTTSRSRSAGMNYERDGETVTDDFELWSLTENSRWATTNFSSRGRHSVEFFFFAGARNQWIRWKWWLPHTDRPPYETALKRILGMDISYEKARATYDWSHT